MAAQEIRTTHVKVPNVDLEIAAYLAAPAVRDLTQLLWCCKRFLGSTPTSSHGTDCSGRLCSDRSSTVSTLRPGFETGYTPEDIEIGKKTTKNQGIRAIGRYSGND